MNSYLTVLKKYAVFSGRASRREYWMFVLFNFIIGWALVLIGRVALGDAAATVLSDVYTLAVFIPGLAVSVRRLHDTDFSGWFMLMALIPILGWIGLIYFLVQDSTPGDNKYGPNPKGGRAVPAA